MAKHKVGGMRFFAWFQVIIYNSMCVQKARKGLSTEQSTKMILLVQLLVSVPTLYVFTINQHFIIIIQFIFS